MKSTRIPSLRNRRAACRTPVKKADVKTSCVYSCRSSEAFTLAADDGRHQQRRRGHRPHPQADDRRGMPARVAWLMPCGMERRMAMVMPERRSYQKLPAEYPAAQSITGTKYLASRHARRPGGSPPSPRNGSSGKNVYFSPARRAAPNSLGAAGRFSDAAAARARARAPPPPWEMRLVLEGNEYAGVVWWAGGFGSVGLGVLPTCRDGVFLDASADERRLLASLGSN
ncbi:hypothetical protein E2562_027218 [Oryza meyeriana var. granulata]|uniref:Uncharacterized protein n=1 Tax=Oryza meyeriana var. granulata TaxID=110450 RepID=A0A6G1EZL0_9ORYZ|nr:hypothetical protein E2562_008084 [Oryza meyeriana var. granulata]KAF0930051.1 hypothetical protein E2562_027218 [Oryza meyeriana var. granulata]